MIATSGVASAAAARLPAPASSGARDRPVRVARPPASPASTAADRSPGTTRPAHGRPTARTGRLFHVRPATSPPGRCRARRHARERIWYTRRAIACVRVVGPGGGAGDEAARRRPVGEWIHGLTGFPQARRRLMSDSNPAAPSPAASARGEARGRGRPRYPYTGAEISSARIHLRPPHAAVDAGSRGFPGGIGR